MTDLERAQMELAAANLELAAAQLQLHEGRAIVEALLKESDWAAIKLAEESARHWLKENEATHHETMSALGALLRGEHRG